MKHWSPVNKLVVEKYRGVKSEFKDNAKTMPDVIITDQNGEGTEELNPSMTIM